MPKATHLPASWLLPLVNPRSGRGLPRRILAGPMEGITEGAFVRTMSRLGLVDAWITPFIRITTGVPRPSKLREKLAEFTATGLPTSVQIMGTNIEFLAQTARRLQDLGVAGVDLNCACPVPIVVGNGAGGKLLTRPAWIREALLAMRTTAPELLLSVKLRTGFESSQEMERILPCVADARPDFIILHFRTVKELYRPIPDGLDRLARARQLLPGQLLIGSGDLFDLPAALEMHRRTGVDGIAPARGLLRQPGLLRDLAQAAADQLPALVKNEKAAFYAEIAADLLARQPQGRGFLLKLLAQAWAGDPESLQSLIRQPTLQALGDELGRKIKN